MSKDSILPSHRKTNAEVVLADCVEFTNPPFSIFPETSHGVANRLVIELQPEEAIRLQIMAKQPGSGMSYIDPPNLVQVELLRRFRDGQTNESVRAGIHLSINGIAAGLRNTG